MRGLFDLASASDFWQLTTQLFVGSNANNTAPFISNRVKENLAPNKLSEVRAAVYYNQYDPVQNPDGVVALAIAENKLMRDEITSHINKHFEITPWHLTYGEGPKGTKELRGHIASYVNDVFLPHVPIKDSDICLSNGAGSVVSNFAFCVGEPGDGILLSRPLYTGFFTDIPYSSKVKLVPVTMGAVDPISADAIPQYEKALLEATKAGITIRAMLIANPHNPLGRPYSREALIALARFCSKHNIHLLSDEVYAQTWFPSKDVPHPPSFVSVLSLDLQNYINPALVHVIYAMSKDFEANGIRLGGLISPYNQELLAAFRSVAGFTRPSQLAEHVWLNLLKDKAFLDWYFPEMRRRMTHAYEYVTKRLSEHNVPYEVTTSGICVWIDLSGYLASDTEDAELALNWRLAKAKVWIAMGATFGAEKAGHYRITFATPHDVLQLGLDRMFGVLEEINRERQHTKGEELGHHVL
ncbi:Putative aminotransferase, class I/classII, pyridoxal phosphate-dependent transferase, major [Septoria linicola]|uniref:Aminotransferase, class I/classII, pyridoxal phosphate-dependent transferase, major n=1 Tax=Septoria linicola TaxID=215465 RepID=A0A9Q9AU85_9PEZI|nr:Putative aminotransferase, class I/classII, pyridoxal phosphate-dependent transferase, major [Septoria linicola]